MVKAAAAVSAVLSTFVVSATTALACGGLVAPDGDVRLEKATTFVAWSGGVEHYVTSFAYQGQAADVGWIVPLPAVPESITTGGRWTLQRLELEVQPPRKFLLEARAAAAADSAQVLQRVQVEALDVTILKGSGAAVIDWCAHNGFALDEETRDHLLRYAEGSPIFMAAKYNTSVAQQRGLGRGDGVPLMMTMRTPRLWVPLEVLANDGANVTADLFLLTDQRPFPVSALTTWPYLRSFSPDSVDGAPGFTLVKQEPMSAALHADLARDRHMGWVPSSGWLSYLTLDAPSEQVTYDLTVGADDAIRLVTFGSKLDAPSSAETDSSASAMLPAALSAAGLALVAAAFALYRRRRTASLSAR